MKKIILTWVLAVILLFSFHTSITALEISVSGNGENTNQTVTILKEESIKVVQDNKATVTNNINATADTGNNTANGNTGKSTIVTGNASSNVVITNNINTNTGNVQTGCCSPTPLPTNAPTVTPDPGNKQPTPTPINNQSSNSDSDTSSSSENSESGGIGGPSGEILGLSATSGDNSILFLTTALICVGLGMLLLGRQTIARG